MYPNFRYRPTYDSTRLYMLLPSLRPVFYFIIQLVYGRLRALEMHSYFASLTFSECTDAGRGMAELCNPDTRAHAPAPLLHLSKGTR